MNEIDSEDKSKKFCHYVLPGGQLVRLIRWKRNDKHEFVVRVTSGSNPKHSKEYLVSWFDANAVYVGEMKRQF